jgi:bifunctional non-homologous end joining protein LigD
VGVAGSRNTVKIGGRSLALSNLDKVLYPATGATKGEVIGYYSAIAPAMLPHCQDRPATRKRWPDGVGEQGEAEAFFQKDVGDAAPAWLATGSIEHTDHINTYPLVNDEATLVWLAQIAALEIHVPQWRFGADGERLNPDRLVLDLDPGPGVELRDCAEVAVTVRDLLTGMGLDSVPVTSGSKGIHLYAPLDGTLTSAQASALARELARSLEADHPGEITSTMKRSVRDGKVFIDWSQNNGSKTTVAPYSLRGRARPTVAAPRTWREIASPRLRQLEFGEVLKRIKQRGDPMRDLAGGGSRDKLERYREMRDASRTPEPVPAPGADAASSSGLPVFVIQRHEARRLHHDFRLERDGVLVSWALPKGVPTDSRRNHLAVPTEDHPMSYRHFEGTIPRGEYGAGEVRIWDEGTFEVEKWRDDEVIATLHGTRDGGLGGSRRFALFRTSVEPPQWMIHLMDDAKTRKRAPHRASTPAARAPLRSTRGAKPAAAEVPRPMLATLAREERIAGLDPAEWAFEMKWDGMRVIARVDGERTLLVSRSGADVTDWFPEFGEFSARLDVDSAVVDGEVVALAAHGAPSFQRLQERFGLTAPREIEAARRKTEASLLLFDVLEINGDDCRKLPYSSRRELLESIVSEGRAERVTRGGVAIPPSIDGDARAAISIAKENSLEGIVAKRRDSPYRAGTRSDDWLKFPFASTQEVAVIGWRTSDADPSGFASVLVAVPHGDELRYAGRVSSGFTAADRRRLRETMRSIERRTPAVVVPDADRRDAHWVRPMLTGEVSYRERTDEGRFRHPVWRGLRPDKDVRPDKEATDA